MGWIKKGLLIKPPATDWGQTHVQNPFIGAVDTSSLKVFFSPRDAMNRAQVAWARLDLDDIEKGVIEYSKAPLLPLGRPGAFDDCGVMPHSIVDVGSRKYLYYTGWSLAVIVPFTLYIGLAVSDDNGQTFARVSEAPVLGRTSEDPLLTAAPWVLFEGGLWRMWYVSCTGWELSEKQPPKHNYRIHYAESVNGVDWDFKNVCIDYEDDEYAMARPVVRRIGEEYEMWFCSRRTGETYRIRRAVSSDGVKWTRSIDPVFPLSEKGWDSEMICYPFVFTHNGRDHMLYNGNDYGKDGCGLAVYKS